MRSRRALCTAAVVYSLLSCSADKAGAPRPTPPVPPAVVSITPSDQAVDAAVGSKIVIVFNKELAPASVNEGTVTLSNATVQLAYDSATATVELTPTIPLAYGTTYTVTVTTAVTDAAGTPMQESFNASFATQMAPPVSGPGLGVSASRYDFPQLAYSNNGDAIAVWLTSPLRGGQALFYSHYDASTTTWSAEALLTVQSLRDPPTLISNGSSFLLLWPTASGVLAWVYSGGAWSEPSRLDVNLTGIYVGSGMRVATASNGYAVTLVTTSAYYRAVYAGGAWTATEAVATGTYEGCSGLASNGTSYLLAWCKYDGKAQRLWVAPMSAAGVVNTSTQVTSGDQGSVVNLSLVSNGTGFAAVWYQSQGSGAVPPAAGLYGGEASDSFAATLLLANAFALSPQLHSNGSDYLAVTAKADGVYAALYASSWQAAAQIAAVTDPQRIHIDGSASGYALTWINSTTGSGPSTEAGAARYAGSTWSTYTLATAQAEVRPVQIAHDTTGYVALWQQTGVAGGASEVAWSRFPLTGPGQLSGTLTGGDVNRSPYLTPKKPSGIAGIFIRRAGDLPEVRVHTFAGLSWDSGSSLASGTQRGMPILDSLAVDGSGRTLAVWRQSDEGVTSRLFAALHDGGAWQAPVWLNDDLATGEVNFVTAVANDNEFLVVWMEDAAVQARRYAQDTWVPRVTLDNGAGLEYYWPPAAAAGSGSFAVAWLQPGGAYLDVNANVFDGATWSGYQVLDNPAINGATDQVHIAAGADGFVAAWLQEDADGNGDIGAAVYAAGSWSDAATLDGLGVDENSWSGYAPALASNGSGYAVGWVSYDSSGEYAARVAIYADATWQTAMTLDAALRTPDVPPTLTPLGDGYAATWYDYDIDTEDVAVWARHYNGTWTPAERVDDSTELPNASEVRAVANTSGYAVIWRQAASQDAVADELHARVYDNGTWSAVARLGDASLSGYPEAHTVLPRRRGYAVIWQQRLAEGATGIFVRTFDGNWHERVQLDDVAIESYHLLAQPAGEGFAAAWTTAPSTQPFAFGIEGVVGF